MVGLEFDVGLPSEWRALGASLSGVRSKERVQLRVPASFPGVPPTVSLRRDFNRDLPHMQPWLEEGRAVPCLLDGDVGELLQARGFSAILDQIAIWLQRAALGELMDGRQGWEPVRRDSYRDYLFMDLERMQNLASPLGGWMFNELRYLRFLMDDGSSCISGVVHTRKPIINARSVGDIGEADTANPKVSFGRSLALVVWPGSEPSGAEIVADVYCPETVTDYASLRIRANAYGCELELRAGVQWLREHVLRNSGSPYLSTAVVLLARRPLRVIGGDSNIELCPYILDTGTCGLLEEKGAASVLPAAHRHRMSRSLLARLAGRDGGAQRPRWTLIGAGSLGSKVALHLARSGNGPEVVVDRARLSPHNAARHALVPKGSAALGGWSDPKAEALSEALRGLGQESKAMHRDAVLLLKTKEDGYEVWSRESWGVLNATASLTLRAALEACDFIPTRVIETSLFAGGRVGLLTVEGPQRNPSTVDLISEYYAVLGRQARLGGVRDEEIEAWGEQSIGQGCGSTTMVMSDGRLSLFAAGMSEYLLSRQGGAGLPANGGRIFLGRLSQDGCGVRWRSTLVEPSIVVGTTMGDEPWKVRVGARAAKKMEAQVARWKHVETGGVPMGLISEASRTVHIVDVLEPPEDSRRSAGAFVLGKKGLRAQIAAYTRETHGALYCLGTWHSHLVSSGPSMTDRATAEALALSRLSPSLVLIHTPEGFRALLVEPRTASSGNV